MYVGILFQYFHLWYLKGLSPKFSYFFNQIISYLNQAVFPDFEWMQQQGLFIYLFI